MLLFVLYAYLRLLIDLTLAPLRDRAADQAELLVLRHQVRVLVRHEKVVRWRQADRLVLAAWRVGCPGPLGPRSWSSRKRCSAGTASWSKGSGRASQVVPAAVDPQSPKSVGS